MAGRTDEQTDAQSRQEGRGAGRGKGGGNDRACYAHCCASGEEESKAPSMLAAATVGGKQAIKD